MGGTGVTAAGGAQPEGVCVRLADSRALSSQNRPGRSEGRGTLFVRPSAVHRADPASNAPARPRDKAKVETAVLVAQRWIFARLRNETFFSIEVSNRRRTRRRRLGYSSPRRSSKTHRAREACSSSRPRGKGRCSCRCSSRERTCSLGRFRPHLAPSSRRGRPHCRCRRNTASPRYRTRPWPRSARRCRCPGRSRFPRRTRYPV
jgi:hypothetical protein